MAKAWLTYAWDDNKSGDVDFVAQELQHAGLTIKLDRWNIGAGKRLWEQIANFIVSSSESDAWILVATQASLSSEPCKEEFAYALDRALKTRGERYPIIALFTGPVDQALIPPGIKSRLFVSITDTDWKERIVSAAEGRAPNIAQRPIEPYYLKVHPTSEGGFTNVIEVRPRAGTWAPFLAAIPSAERQSVNHQIAFGPANRPTMTTVLFNHIEAMSGDGQWWIRSASNEATPTSSYYVWCRRLPSKLIFGVDSSDHQYTATF